MIFAKNGVCLKPNGISGEKQLPVQVQVHFFDRTVQCVFLKRFNIAIYYQAVALCEYGCTDT
jgi:hypothetical protein